MRLHRAHSGTFPITTKGHHMRDIAITAIFIAEGFFEGAPTLTDPESSHYGGQIGAAAVLADYAVLVNSALTAVTQRWPDIEYPGVFDYEVSVTLGTFLRGAEKGDPNAALEYLVALFPTYFNKSVTIFGHEGQTLTNPGISPIELMDVARQGLLKVLNT